MKTILAVVSFAACVSCYDPNAQRSAIVRRAEAAGAGNLSTFDAVSLGTWFASRPALATEISNACASIHPDASWARTAEGATCIAAMRAAPAPTPLADRRAW